MYYLYLSVYAAVFNPLLIGDFTDQKQKSSEGWENGDSFFICYWLNQHGKEAMLDMPLWSCQLQQHILADPVNSF